jgi:hypothetical protein
VRIVADDRVGFPRDLVYRTYRDRLVELVPYLPNVRAIDVRERKEDADAVRLVNVWHADAEIPAVARSVLRPDMLGWTDRAVWRQSDWTTAWRIETHAFTEAVTCAGQNEFVSRGDATEIRIRGDLRIDLRKVRAVPRLLAGTVGPVVERFVVAMITPNLSNVSRGIERLLAKEAGG